MKYFITIFGLCLLSVVNAQTVTKYYDVDWQETGANKAVYYAEFSKIDGGYKCFSYWKGTKKKREESLYADTSMSHPNGLQKVYAKNGSLEDSLFFNADGTLAASFHYYPNGKLECHYVGTGKGEVKEAYDEAGGKIKNYIFSRAAEPKGGLEKWQSFIKKNTSRELGATGTERQLVNVKIRFIVDPFGAVVNPKIIESSGIKSVDQDALRVIGSSPEWSPAIYKNKPIRFPVTQPLTYELLPAKR